MVEVLSGLKGQALNPRKILIIRLSSLGDILLTTPLIRALRQRFPAAQIDFVVKSEYVQLLHNNPHLNRIHPLDCAGGFAALRRLKRRLRRESYDLVLDLHKNFRSFYLRLLGRRTTILSYKKYVWKRLLLIYLGVNLYGKVVPVYRRYLEAAKGLGLSEATFRLDLVVPEQVRSRVRERLIALGWSPDGVTVALAPGAGFFTKRWLPERFAEVADALVRSFGAQVLLLGSVEDREPVAQVEAHMSRPAINLAGDATLEETAAAMQLCSLVVCNDSGLMHMAEALDKPTIAIFGSTTRELGFFPQGARTRVVEKKVRCRPCSHIGRDRCPKRHFRCMSSITAAEISELACELLRGELAVMERTSMGA